jgi:hypothetical protein
MADKSLLPTYDELKKIADKTLSGVRGIFSTSTTDVQGHTSKHFNTKEEKQYCEILTRYQMFLESQSVPLITMIIIEAIKEKKLTFPILINFLKKNSWIGKTITKKIQNQQIPYNWLGFIAPSLLDYFNEMDYFIASGEPPNLVLCIDSLTLKIEGLLRDLCTGFGIATFHPTKDSHVYREKDLTMLLHEEKIGDLFDKDELLLFKFVLVEKAGYNMRHNIAHALTFWGDYQLHRFHLLLLILLRIGKYNLGKNTANTK